MKKLIALLAAGLLAGSVYAADFKITGDAYVRGSATRNLGDSNAPGTDAAKNFYDMEFHLFPVIQVDKNTKIVMKFTADFDQVPDKSSSTTWAKDYAAKGQGVSDGPTLTVENLYVSHLFESTGTEVLAGLFTGGTWGTSFGDTEYDAFRVRVNQKVPFGKVIAYLQKNQDSPWSSASFKDEGNEKDDNDGYVVAGLFNIGGINLKPYVGYTHAGANHAYSKRQNDAYNNNTVNLKFAADGKFGIIGFEGEVDYDIARRRGQVNEPASADSDTFGIYGNIYANMMSNVTVGGKFAYASYDKDANKGFAFGDNFDPTLAIDDYMFSNGAAGMTLIQAYADVKVMDPLTVGASFSYYFSNIDGSPATHNVKDDYGRMWNKDTKAWEIDVYGTYDITKYLAYSVAGGYAKVYDLSDGTVKYDAKGAYRIFHKLAVKF